MAGLCESGNEPSGSLKAFLEEFPILDAVVDFLQTREHLLQYAGTCSGELVGDACVSYLQSPTLALHKLKEVVQAREALVIVVVEPRELISYNTVMVTAERSDMVLHQGSSGETCTVQAIKGKTFTYRLKGILHYVKAETTALKPSEHHSQHNHRQQQSTEDLIRMFCMRLQAYRNTRPGLPIHIKAPRFLRTYLT
ncbi:hypothetical protein ANN_05893 [Periplaneta americana]|uniref:Uncharacterized protein n=1 Tax=Periplaneta americana TaxID=6978 RepID=A0ABQ8TC26_PERAM|nr:hypothetical protein ANN_05893 [Periplaneta americana]